MSVSCPPVRRRGFALVIALGLMSFCLLLLITISALSRVEVSVSTSSRDKMAAQMNALCAVQVALGRLQEAAGPDTRVTAPADILDTTNAFPAGNGDWLGVWQTEGAQGASVYEETESVRQWSQGIGPEWLLSYDEVQDPSPSPASALSGDTVVLRTIRDDNGTSQQVSAGLIPIGDTAKDAFAYMVADHSLRPDASLVPGQDRVAPTQNSLEERLNFVSPARSAIFSRDEFSAADSSDPQLWEDIGRVPGESYLSLLPQVQAASVPPTADSYEDRYSYGSFGLLTDTRRGGLRKDLTRYLMDGQGLSDSSAIFDPGDYPDLPSGALSQIPKWGIARGWYTAGSALSVSSGTAPYIQPQSDSQFGLHPILIGVQVRIGFAYKNVEVSPGVNEDKAILLIFPRVDLWNPYNVTLPETDYLLRVRAPLLVKPDDRSILDPGQRFQINNSGGSVSGPIYSLSSAFNLNDWLLDGQSEPYLEFKVSAPDIPPGLVLPLVLNGDGNYVRGDVDATAAIGDEGDYTGFVQIDTGLSISPNITPADRDAPAPTNITYITYLEPVLNASKEMVVELRLASSSALLQRVHSEREGWVNTGNGNSSSTWADSAIDKYVSGESDHEVPAGGMSVSVHSNCYWYDDTKGWRFSKRLWADFSLRVSDYDRSSVPRSDLLFFYLGSNGNEIEALDAGVFDSPNINHSVVHSHYLGNRAANDDDLYRYVFYEIPRTGGSGAGITSLGQLQHLPLASGFWQPANALGNAWAPFWVKRDEYAGYYNDGSDADRIFDLSYLTNESLWDRYFLSAWDGSGVPEDADFASGVLRVSESIPSNSAVDDFDRAAEFLAIAGAFNVNSTSVDAWRDLLLAGEDLSAIAGDGSSIVPTGEVPFPRFAYPYQPASPIDGTPKVPASGNDVGHEDNWAGMRSLDSAEIGALADAITDEVRARGPFLSLADFVNRQLIDDSGADALGRDAAIGIRGALQAAIDTVSQPQDAGDVTSGGILNAEFNYDSVLAARNNKPGWTAPERLTHSTVDQPEHWLGTKSGQIGHRMAGLPGFLTQADLLTVIGPRLTARGDTFTIIGYGEHKDALSGKVRGAARCEAVVRRRTEFIDSSDSPTDDSASLSQLNLDFGRRFEIVSFKWTEI